MSNAPLANLTLIPHIDNVPRPVVALRAATVSQDWEYARHQHRKAQLLYSVRGILHCEIEDGLWIVPSRCAIWIPGNLAHSVRSLGMAECHCLFVEPESAPELLERCCTISVSPLLRELLLKAVGFSECYALEGREARLIGTLLDELATASVENLHLPLPRDPRLRRLANLLLEHPAEQATKSVWAARVGMSERSMSRHLLREIGMSFGRWRRQLHVILALQRLSKGERVQAVALELGYENASGFVTMFRKAVGKPPARYLSDQTRNVPSTVVSGIMLSVEE
jgi:AraC-like DNA-binding protein